jgi:hypothetical protein
MVSRGARDRLRSGGRDGADSAHRQHGEEVYVVVDTATASQLGRIVNAADPVADQRPVAEVIGAHHLAELTSGLEGWRWSPARQMSASAFPSARGLSYRQIVSVERTGAGSRSARVDGRSPAEEGRSVSVRVTQVGYRRALRRWADHPVGCSSSRFSRRSIPSRMRDEVFRYLVYGTTSRILSRVA